MKHQPEARTIVYKDDKPNVPVLPDGLLKRCFEIAKTPLCILDSNGTLVASNQFLLNTPSWPNPGSGMLLRQIIDPEFLPAYHQLVNSGDEAASMVLQCIGNEQLWRVNSIARDEQFQILEWQPEIFPTDFSHKFDNLFGDAIEPVFVMDDSGIIRYCNRAILDLIKYDREQFTGTSLDTHVLVSEERMKNRWSKFLSEGTLSGVVDMRCGDGSEIHVEYRATCNVFSGLHLVIMRDRSGEQERQSALNDALIQLNALVQNTTDINVLIGEDRCIISLNEAAQSVALRVIGREINPGDNFHAIIQLIKQETEFETYFGQAFRGERVEAYLTVGSPLLGETYWEATFSPAYDRKGQIIGVVFDAKDVTEQQRMVQLLQKNKEAAAKNSHLLQSVLDSPQDVAIYSLDTEFRYLAFSHTHRAHMRRLTGQEIVSGTNMLEYFLDSDSVKLLKDSFTQALAGKSVHFIEEELIDDACHYWDCRIAPIHSDANSVIGLTCFRTEITESRKAAEIIRESESRYRTLIERAYDGVLIYNLKGDILEFNDKAYNFLGYTPEEFRQLKLNELFFETELSQHPIQFDLLHRGQSTIDHRRLKRKDGTGIDMELNSTMLDDGNILVFGRDITERKKQHYREKSRAVVLEMLSKGAAFKDVLKEIVLGAERLDPGIIASILIYDSQANRLLEGAAPSLPETYNRAIETVDIGYGVGACGTAAFTGERVVVENIFTHPFFEPYLFLFEGLELGACWSEPIKDASGKVLGTFALYHKNPCLPSAKDLEVIKELTDIASIVFTKHFADQELKKTADSLHEISEIALVGGFDINMRLGRIEWSSVTKKIFEVPDDYVGSMDTAFEFYKENTGDRDKIAEQVQEICTTGNPFVTEVRITGLNGTEKWIRIKCQANFEEGVCVRLYGTKQDITAQKQIDLALQQSEEKFRSMISNISDVISLLDVQGNVKFQSRSIKPLLGYDANELVGINVFEHIHPDDVPGLKEALMENVKNGGVSPMMEFRFRHKNGEYIQLEAQGNNQLKNEFINGIIIVSRDISARKAAEQKQREREAYFRTLIKHSASAIILFDEQGRFIYQSPVVTKIMGYDVQCPGASSLVDFIHPDDRNDFLKQFQHLREKHGNSATGVFRFLHNNGHYVWLEVTGTNMTEDPVIGAYIGNYHDVTQRKLAEEKTINERKLLKTLIDNIPDLIYVKDCSGKKLIANKADVKFMNLESEEQAVGKTDLELFPGSMGTAGHENDLQVMKEGSVIHLKEDKFFDKAGNERWLLVSKLALRNSENEVFGMLGIARDITEQKKQALEREEAESRFRALVENSNDGTAIMQVDGSVTYVTPSIHRILGYTEEEAKSLNIFALKHPEDAEIQAKASQLLIERPGEPITGFVFRMKHKDGSWRWIEDTITNMLDTPGINGVVVNFRDVTEKTLIENKIIEEKQLLDSIINSLPGIFYMYTPEGKFVRWNKNFAQQTGFSNEEIAEMRPHDFYRDAPTDWLDKRIKQLQDGPQPGIDVTINCKDGSILPLYITSRFIEIGDTKCVTGIGLDVTDRIRREEELRQSNERFEYASAATNDAIWDYDLQTNQVKWSTNYEKLFGLIDQETSDSSVNEWIVRIHPEDRERVANSLSEFVSSNSDEAWLVEYRYLKSDGSYANVLDKGVVIRNAAGMGYRMIGALQDITYRVRAQEQLKMFESVITNTNEGVVITSVKSNQSDSYWIEYANHAFCDMTGYDLDELIGQSPQIFQGPQTNRVEVERMNQALAQHLPVETELINYRKNGETYWVNISITPIRDDHGTVTHWISIQKDVSQRKKEEANLNRLNQELAKRALDLNNSNRELERFAYVASHDLQEPLRMVSSFLSLLEKKYQEQLDEVGTRYIHFAVDGAERMKRLIYDLLEYSRVSTNKETVGNTDMNEIVNEIRQTFVVTCNELSAVIENEPLPVLHNTRRTLMFQLMQNLIGNALKYHSDQPPVIKISVEEEIEHWLFAVKDNGIGIKPIFAEKIFVIFQRLHNRDQYSGTGIGLSICKKIVEIHGGRIWVESELGQGATFWFTIKK